jgi:hypothetical protein
MDFVRHREAVPSPVRFLYCPFCGTRYDVSDGECRVCRSKRGVLPYTGTNSEVRRELEGVSGPVWRKVLWDRQPFADNYTHESFLSCLSVNSTPRSYDWRILMRESTVVVQHASLIVILAAVFFRLQDYSYVLGSEGTLDSNRSAVALNSGLFSVVIVASRLSTVENSMTYLVCGICAIAFAPDLFRAVYVAGQPASTPAQPHHAPGTAYRELFTC